MWMVFGVLAVITAVLNLVYYFKGKNGNVFRFASLSFTALTVCDLYAQVNAWVVANDWVAIEDVVPTMSAMLWRLVIISIIINGISLIKSRK